MNLLNLTPKQKSTIVHNRIIENLYKTVRFKGKEVTIPNTYNSVMADLELSVNNQKLGKNPFTTLAIASAL